MRASRTSPRVDVLTRSHPYGEIYVRRRLQIGYQTVLRRLILVDHMEGPKRLEAVWGVSTQSEAPYFGACSLSLYPSDLIEMMASSSKGSFCLRRLMCTSTVRVVSHSSSPQTEAINVSRVTIWPRF